MRSASPALRPRQVLRPATVLAVPGLLSARAARAAGAAAAAAAAAFIRTISPAPGS